MCKGTVTRLYGGKSPKRAYGVTVRGRNGTRWELLLDETTRNALRRYLATRAVVGTSRLFITKFGKGIGPRAIENLITKHLREANVYDGSVHTLCHTFAVLYLQKGFGLEALKTVLGHALFKTIIFYAEYPEHNM